MSLPDWNNNGERDLFDHYVDMQIMDETNEPDNSTTQKPNNDKPKGISMGGVPIYDATKDSDGVIIFKSILVIILCFGGMLLPVALDLGTIGTLLCLFGGIAASIAVLKNV